MSGGRACRCLERTLPIEERHWAVEARRGNRSAFSGYRWTPSEWSRVRCSECGAVWRTRAGYVDDLPDDTEV